MGRERLMEEQRARMEARRKQLKKEVEKAKAKKVKKAVTRDTSKDQSRKTVNRLTGSTTPKTGAAAKQTLSKFAGKKPAPAPKAKPAPTPAPKAKPAPAPKPKAKATPHRGKQRFADGGKGGKFDTSSPNNLKMSEHPGLKQNQKPKKPKMGATKTVNGQAYYYDGSKWVKGKLGKTTRLK